MCAQKNQNKQQCIFQSIHVHPCKILCAIRRVRVYPCAVITCGITRKSVYDCAFFCITARVRARSLASGKISRNATYYVSSDQRDHRAHAIAGVAYASLAYFSACAHHAHMRTRGWFTRLTGPVQNHKVSNRKGDHNILSCCRQCSFKF